MHTFRKFQQGDKVSYVGNKFARDLSGALGIIDSFVGNSESEFVVTFGSDSFVMHEKCLTRFQGKTSVKEDRSPEKEAAPKDVEITKRRGGKRRPGQDEG